MLCGQGHQFCVPDGVSSWGSASPCWGGGGGSVPQEAGDWEPAASDFPARTWRGEDRGRLEGPCPAAPRPESSASGASGTARWPGKQGFRAARCSIVRCAPQKPPDSCSDAKDSRGQTAPGRSQGAGHLRDAKPQVPVETQVPVSLPPLFGPGGHGGHLERGEAGFGLRADPSGRAGSGTADLPPAAAPESQAILL